MLCLAHWTISQRTIRVILPKKSEVCRHEKLNPTGTLGDAIGAARMQACLTHQQLSKATGLPTCIGLDDSSVIVPCQAVNNWRSWRDFYPAMAILELDELRVVVNVNRYSRQARF